jgi:arsenite methyltransferase
METEVIVDADKLREEVTSKYREVALDPHGEFHFHTGRPLAERLGYNMALVNELPDIAVESFAGVANPFSLGQLAPGSNVIDAGSGAGFDSFIASSQVTPGGQVIGIDMTDEMLNKSQSTAELMGRSDVSFRKGLIEDMPVEDGWADVVISNGVFNLCADKPAVFKEVLRVLKPGGRLQFADIANGAPVPESAAANIDLWTA